MNLTFKNITVRISIILILITWGFTARASHMIGGDITYRCLGNNRYQITITLFQDCLNGEPEAIAQDDPANYSIYRNSPIPLLVAYGNVRSASTDIIPTGFSNECITNYPNTCLRRQVFVFEVELPPDNVYGYTIVYQRCCRNAVIQNIINPGNIGVTYSATIPPSNSDCANNSAVFKNVPPQIICSANPFAYDFSATDIDGDSLSYELCTAYRGGSTSQSGIAPSGDEITPPPFSPVPYLPPYSSQMPMSGFPPLQIDPVTGMLTITPNTVGRFVISVCVHEWRNGIIINTLSRDVQFVVTNCSKTVVANIPQFSTQPNTYIVECTGYTVQFVNQSSGGFNYIWDFGDGTPTSTDFEPTHTYADTGVYVVKLVVNDGSTCPDSITRFVKIFPVLSVDFDFDGIHCPKDTISFSDLSTATYRPFASWSWSFGDGDSSTMQNPVHAYAKGGDYAVQLIATTIKGCVDTITKTVDIDRFEPFAGNDTIIVLGYPYSLHASGGDFYHWSPSNYLSNPNVPDPAVNFPDTGHYTFVVDVASEANCHGSDTINVWVVKDGGILMPNAFTPNGDGVNDVVKPLLIGYTKLNYFRIFNRWGQLVFATENIDEGWDGRYNGQIGDLSTYYWIVSADNISGQEDIKKGDLTLLR